VDFSKDFGPSDHGVWDAEYAANAKPTEWPNRMVLAEEKPVMGSQMASPPPALGDVLKEFERMDPVERQSILDELADRPELWNNEMEAFVL
jgi:hypothetical protein